MRLAEALAEEELQEVRVVLPPVVVVVLGPALVLVEPGVDRVTRPSRQRLTEWHGRGLEYDGLDPLRVLGSQSQRPCTAHREADDDRPLRPGRVEDGDRVLDELGVGIGLGLRRTV